MKKTFLNLLTIAFICTVFTSTITEIACADVANGGAIVGMSILYLGLVIAVIWVIAFFILKWIRKKNDK